MYISYIGMITAYNPIYSILFMINILILMALNLVFINITYLGLIFVMIYIGAIVILFLFVIMMIPLKKVIHKNTTYLIISFYFLFFVSLKYINKFSLFSNNYFFLLKKNSYLLVDRNILKINENVDNISLLKIGAIIFNYYYLYLFISGLILLIVIMIGSIFITNKQYGRFSKKQYNSTYMQDIINIYNKSF